MGKKAIKADLEVPTATVVRSQEKCKSGGRMGICRMKWNMKQQMNWAAICIHFLAFSKMADKFFVFFLNIFLFIQIKNQRA